MGRPKNREPFWRSDRACWYVQSGTRHIRLSPDKDEAWRLWHEFMAKPPEQRAAPRPPDTRLVAVVLDTFLDWVKANKAHNTYTWNRARIQAFLDAIPPLLAVSDLKPHHVTRVMDAHPGWSASTKNGFGRSVQQAFRWAKRQGLIDSNPIEYVEKPGGQAREMAISPAQYTAIMEVVTEPCARTLLHAAWETGARPQELRAIEARHIDFDLRRIVFPASESKGKKRQRVIYLTDEGLAILKPLCEERPAGALLRNSDGETWTKDAINCFFCRLKKKLGVKYHLGAFRKGYATEAIKAGVDVISLAHLLGHQDATMLSKVYAKVHQDPVHMADMAKKARKATGR
jgi:integrase